jgi:anti-sigma factor RsiW
MMSGDIVTKTKNIRVGTRPVPVDGFYEWKKGLGGTIPYSISMKDDSPFVFAVVGGLERSREQRMAAHLYDDHWRTKRVCAGNSHTDAGHPTGRAPRCLVIV